MEQAVYVTELVPHTSGRIKRVMEGTMHTPPHVGSYMRCFVKEGYPNTFGISLAQHQKIERGEHVLAACSGGVQGGIVLYAVGKTPWAKTGRDSFAKLTKNI